MPRLKKHIAHNQGANLSGNSKKPYNLGDLTPAQRALSDDDLIATLIEENKKYKSHNLGKAEEQVQENSLRKRRPAHKFQVNSKHSCEEADPSDEALRKRFVR